MWREKFNLGPDRVVHTRKRDEPQEAPPQEAPKREHPLERYKDEYGDLYQVVIFMDLHMQNGKIVPIGIKLLVPDVDLGAFCEVLHCNGIDYDCAKLDPEEGSNEKES